MRQTVFYSIYYVSSLIVKLTIKAWCPNGVTFGGSLSSTLFILFVSLGKVVELGPVVRKVDRRYPPDSDFFNRRKNA